MLNDEKTPFQRSRRSPLTTFIGLVACLVGGHLLVSQSVKTGFGAELEKALERNQAVVHDVSLTSVRDASLIIANATNPILAKKHHLFWIERATDAHAVDVLAHPELFRSMFPGYPESMAQDGPLWDDYFERTFEIDSFVPAIAEHLSPDFIIVHSWLGCLDIYRRYGADTLIIGTSETFRSVIPEVLSQQLTANGASPERVLLCTGAALQLDSTIQLAKKLTELRPDAKPRVLFGLSLSTLFVEGKRNVRNGLEKSEELADYDFREARSRTTLFNLFARFHAVSFADLFPHLTWDDFAPESQAAINDQLGVFGYARKAREASTGKTEKRFVLMSLLDRPTRLNEDIEARIHPYYHAYDDFKPEMCQSSRTDELLSQAVQALEKASSHLYIFVPPTTPLATFAAPACLRERLQKAISDLADHSPEVYALNQPWNEFGLSYADYVRPTRNPEVGIVDIQHVNYKGAVKVSNVLATWMKTPNREIRREVRGDL